MRALRDRRTLVILALVLLFLAVRVVFLSASLEEVVNNDELTVGLVWHWLGGARAVPLVDLWTPRTGADGIYQFLALPLRALLGGSALTVKALALLVALAGLLLLVAVGRHHGQPRAGLYAGLLYALAPPGWVGISLVGTGDHVPAGLLAIAAAHLLLLARDAEPPRRGRLLLGLGLLCGLSLFANYLFAVAIVALVLVALLCWGRWRGRDAAPLLLGLAVGALPLVATFAGRGLTAATTLYRRGAGEQLQLDPLRTLERLWQLLGPDLADAAWFPPGALGTIGAWLWWVLVLAALLWAVWTQREVVLGLLPRRARELPAIETFLVLFGLGFGLTFATSSLDVEPGRIFGYRYLAVLYAPSCLLAGLALARLPRSWGPGLAALWWLPCLLALAWPWQLRDPLRVADLPGVTWTNAASRALDAWHGDLAGGLEERLPLIPEPDRAAFLVSFGGWVGERVPAPEVYAIARAQLEPRWRLHLYRGLLHRGAPPTRDPDLVGVRDLLRPPHPQLPPGALEDPTGWLRGLDPSAHEADLRLQDLGRALISTVDRSPSRLTHELAQAATPEQRPALCQGIGEGLVLYHKTPMDLGRWRIPWDDRLGSGCQAAFERGAHHVTERLYAADPAYRDRALTLLGAE